MDWNERNNQITFYKQYLEYLSKARDNKLNEDDRRKLMEPLLLSPFEKSAIIAVLKDTISKIIIINHGYNGNNRNIELSVGKPPMHIRFNKPILDQLYNEETLEPLRECFEAISKTKLETDIDAIRCALEICCSDLQEFGDFRNFSAFIFNENREAYDEYNLLKTYGENITKKKKLRKELKKNARRNEALIAKLDEKLFNLKTECENRVKINQLEANMVKKWENARQEQVDAVFNHELKTLYRARDDYEENTERELIVINEILAFYRKKCTELENSLEAWQQRYATERTELDEQIKYTEQCIEDVRSKHELIRSLYEKREQFIKQYYIEQKQLEEIRRIEAGQRAAAIRIQAWWRGMMVHKQLGPYRPKKKSKKPKPGKTKK